MSDAYSECVGGSLKLKTAASGVKKKKKKKNKAEEVVETVEKVEAKVSKTTDSRTPAQIAYDKVQEQRQAERILKKAQKTHKQRVEEYTQVKLLLIQGLNYGRYFYVSMELNRHLDSLTEHYDIPKVAEI